MNKVDKMLLVSVFAILIMGLLMLFSASIKYYSHGIVLRQVVWMAIGVIILLLISQIDYQRILITSYFMYAFTIAILLFVLFFSKARGGSHRWINMGAFSIQPSEIAKITLVLALSSYMSVRKSEVHKLSFIIRVFALVIPIVLLVLMEPDLGTSLLFIPITIAMLFAAGARPRHLVGIMLLGMGAVPFLWQFLKDYQKQRLLVFLDPNIDPLGSGYTIIQSKIAVGSGGLFGKGWLSGTQNQLNFLPERHTDFIFSVIGEEWGFMGALVLIGLFAVVIYRGIKIIERTPDLSGRLIATGFITLFAVQAIVNIGMTIGVLPIVGLTLPLVSYGGSSLVTMLTAIGIVLNVGTRRSLF